MNRVINLKLRSKGPDTVLYIYYYYFDIVWKVNAGHETSSKTRIWWLPEETINNNKIVTVVVKRPFVRR